MTNLLVKSKEHLEAAQLLNDGNCHSSVPHCAYYSCFQLLMFIENSEIPDTGEESHLKLIKTIKKEITNRKNENASNDFHNDILKLKTSRVLADYKQKIYYRKESQKCIDLAKNLSAKLVQIFQVQNY